MADLARLNEVTDNLRGWAAARDAVNDRKPRRRGGALSSQPLLDAISLLEEYRGIINRLDVADVVFEGDPAVLELLTSIRSGFPIRSKALSAILHPAPRITLGCGAPGCGGCRDVEAPRRGSGWGT